MELTNFKRLVTLQLKSNPLLYVSIQISECILLQELGLSEGRGIGEDNIEDHRGQIERHDIIDPSRKSFCIAESARGVMLAKNDDALIKLR